MPFGRNTEWRYLVTALDGRHITTMDAHARDRSIEYGLLETTVMRGVISSDSEEINRLDLDGFPYLAEGDRLLYCLRRDYNGDPAEDPFWCRAAGIILQYDDAADPDSASSSFTAFDPWEYLNHLTIVNPNNPEASGVLDLKYLRTEVQDIVQSLMVNASVYYNTGASPTSALANMFIDFGQTAWYEGTFETLPEITHTFQKGTSIGDGLRELCARGRCDIILRPIYDPVNRPGYLAEMSVYEIAGVVKPEAIFAWDKPSHSLQEISRNVDGTRRANNVRWHTWVGGGEVTVPQISALSIARFGDYYSDQYIVSSEHTGQTADYADDWLETYAEHAREVSLTSIPERCPEPFLEWYLGDQVRVFASDQLRATMSGFQRVSGFTIDIDDNSVETVRDLRIYITGEGVDIPEDEPTVPVEGDPDDLNAGDDPPVLVTATGLDDEITLSYNVGLNTASVPATSAYTVTVAASPVTVTAVVITGSNVVLTLATPITPGDVTEVDYVVPGVTPVESVLGTDAGALTNESVDTGTLGGGGGELGAPRSILTFRVTGAGGDTGHPPGQGANITAHWLAATSANTPRTNGGAAGRYFIEGERWKMIMGIKPIGDTRLGRVFNWHDMPHSGYVWGAVSPVAFDRNATAETEGNEVADWFTLQYAQSSADKHTEVELIDDEWNWMFADIYFHRTNGIVVVRLTNSARNATVGDTPLVNLSGVRTLVPNTGWYPGVQFWQGLYATNYAGGTIVCDHVAAMVGPTWDAAWKDTPVRVTDWGSNLSSYAAITSKSTSDIIVPNSIAAQIIG